MYEFRHHPLEGYEPIVQAFAQFTAHMHEEGILHRDYSPGNILFDVDEKGQVHFEIVDINRMVFDKPVGLERACRNFCRLWGKEDFFRLLATEYAKARGFDETECTRLTIKYWKRFWRFRK
jgi:serine/threonine protein kinase